MLARDIAGILSRRRGRAHNHSASSEGRLNQQYLFARSWARVSQGVRQYIFCEHVNPGECFVSGWVFRVLSSLSTDPGYYRKIPDQKRPWNGQR